MILSDCSSFSIRFCSSVFAVIVISPTEYKFRCYSCLANSRRDLLKRQILRLLIALHSSQRNRTLSTLPHIAQSPASLRIWYVLFFVFIARPTHQRTRIQPTDPRRHKSSRVPPSSSRSAPDQNKSRPAFPPMTEPVRSSCRG